MLELKAVVSGDETRKRTGADRRFIIALGCLVLGATAAAAQPLRATYAEARRAFESQPVESRMRLQVLLTAAGYMRATAHERFNPRVFDSIQSLQRSKGLIPDGVLSAATVAQLVAEARPLLERWDMQQRFHLFTMRKLWVPVGVLQVAEPIGTGMLYKDPFGHVRMEHSFVEDSDLTSSYRHSLERARTDGGRVGFRLRRPNFYAIAWTSAGGGAFLRYHRRGSGLYGFALYWDGTAGVEADRIAKLIAMSLTADLTGRALVEPVKVLTPFRTQTIVTAPAGGPRP